MDSKLSNTVNVLCQKVKECCADRDDLSFVDLNDTPNTLAFSPNEIITVNGDGDKLVTTPVRNIGIGQGIYSEDKLDFYSIIGGTGISVNLLPNDTIEVVNTGGLSSQYRIFLSNGGNNIGSVGAFIGQGNISSVSPNVEIVSYEDGRITGIIATKDGVESGTATLYIDGVSTALSVNLAAGSANGSATGTVIVSQFSRISVLMEPGSSGWGYGAVTLNFVPN